MWDGQHASVQDASGRVEDVAVGGFLDETSADKDAMDDFEMKQQAAAANLAEGYSQQVFDELNRIELLYVLRLDVRQTQRI